MAVAVNVLLFTRVEVKLRRPPLTEMPLGVLLPGVQGSPWLHFKLSSDVPLNSSAKVKAQFVPEGGAAGSGAASKSREPSGKQRRAETSCEQ